MLYELPPLPYAYNALEPYMDARTVEIHYTKHHQAYVDGLNKVLEKAPESIKNKPVEELLQNSALVPEALREDIIFFGGGHINHALFWQIMKPAGGGEPKGKLAQAIKKSFGDFATFKEKLSAAAKKVRGSGWAWVCVAKDGTLVISETLNHVNPLSQGLKPIICIDVWEHAYYLKYQNRRPEFIEAWWNLINWDTVEKYYQEFFSKK